MKHIKLCLALLVSLPACGQVEGGQTTADPAACAPVECTWTAENTCESENSTYSFQTRFEEIDDGAAACWFYDSVCIPRGTPVDCVPDSCRRTHVECQPTGEYRNGYHP